MFPAKFFLSSLIFVLCFGLSSCKKESDIGLDLVPANDLIDLRVTDTTTVYASTVREDSLRTDEPGAALLGNTNDVIFGKATAGFFTQLRIPNNQVNISFGTMSDLALDSAVLTLSLKPEFYGDTLQTQKINVYQMTEALDKSKNYYSNHVQQYYPTAIGTTTFSPRPNTKVVLAGDTFAPHVRVRLDQTFAQLIFNQSGTQNLNGNDNFLNFLKGLYIEADESGHNPGEGVISTIGLLDSMSRMTLYYRNTVTPDTLKYSFVIGTDAANYCYFKHDYSAAPINPVIGQTGSHANAYVQGISGLKTRIDMPYFDAWKNKMPIAINKAELVLKVDPSTIATGYPANDRFYVTSRNSDGTEEAIIDLNDFSLFGGQYSSATNEYTINMTRYFQSIVSGEKNFYGLFVKELTPVASARRVVLGGDQAGPYKMRLRITYTKIN